MAVGIHAVVVNARHVKSGPRRTADIGMRLGVVVSDLHGQSARPIESGAADEEAMLDLRVRYIYKVVRIFQVCG